MLPRNAADYRTLLWVAIAVALVAVQFSNSQRLWIVLLAPANAYFALCCGIIAHNHNHCPVFANRRMNDALGHVLSLFYGYPTFVWVPTHNLNHHKHVNRAGDATITWRYTNRHNLFVALTYFFVSAYFQAVPVKAFIRKAKQGNRRLYRKIQWQYAVWIGVWLSLLGLAMGLQGWRIGLWIWGFSIGLPSLFTLWVIMFFNYEQHVHTDPWSAHNHSRNFTSKTLNFLLFNNGYHGAHHEQPGLHWSQLPAAYERIADQIHPDLVQRSMWWFIVKQFLLAPLSPRLGSRQIGRAPFDPPSGRPTTLETDDVELGEAGANADMALG
jgi:beta-carotene hydroxylase